MLMLVAIRQVANTTAPLYLESCIAAPTAVDLSLQSIRKLGNSGGPKLWLCRLSFQIFG
jgi:hypothetical protein